MEELLAVLNTIKATAPDTGAPELQMLKGSIQNRPIVSMRLMTALVMLASPALAWGPVTHCYIASCVTGTWDADVILGAMLPDCNAILRHNPEEARHLKQLSHREFDRLASSPFAAGFKTHNAIWGADYYAHLCYDSSAEDIYSTMRIKQLSNEFGISMSHAEDVLEMCVDIQLRLKLGPVTGVRIARVAEVEEGVHEQALVEAFAAELASRVDGLSVEEAEQDIRAAVQIHKMLLVALGEQLQLSEEEIHTAIPSLLKIHLEVDEATAATYYRRGLEITADCMVEMDRICAAIKAAMSATSEGEPDDEAAKQPS